MTQLSNPEIAEAPELVKDPDATLLRTPAVAGRLLVLDPTPDIGESAAIALLRQRSYDVQVIKDVRELIATLAVVSVDMVIVDFAAESFDRLAFCQQLRDEGNPPFMIWSAQTDPLDKVVGLELGAEDYVAKDAHPLELLARVRVILRRERMTGDAAPGLGGADHWRLDPRTRLFHSGKGQRVRMSASSVMLLLEMCRRPRDVVTRQDIAALLAPGDETYGRRSGDVAISRLRASMAQCSQADRLICTLKGGGWALEARVAFNRGAWTLHDY